MAALNEDLHGNVPDEAPAALLLIDVINDLEYEGGERLLAQALPMAERIAALRRRARDAGASRTGCAVRRSWRGSGRTSALLIAL